ncbi:unnamed protein product [Penicillium olsonii]|uniref:N-acetyltransferase domain-containing protein n=1 Tax=Penicillium olsonii TaxID=99116 RepID=A0A9W4HNI2_PENOL|nr:unnamed protein product [Penicillium olsonii]CAG7929805.1 unnamed protein product [Penicillium olsonii]CAG8069804.1 unnamed protein product [Penicillium olsonii]CAG8172690.1 unnamed protein product [Penicillium olsonii]CAG8184486.1 unnamed protein product [Penicillium olsonii]
MPERKNNANIGLQVELIDEAHDITEAFHCVCEAFGRQAEDGVWIAMNPGWDTPEGKSRGASRIVERWSRTSKDIAGNPNTMFLKATLPSSEDPEKRITAGFAIWVQASNVEGHGDPQIKESEASADLTDVYPEDQSERRYLAQVMASLHGRRRELVEQARTAEPPALFVLDLCAVDPAHQRKGIAKQLVQWGLDEALRRGIPEAITEASSMGRHVYENMGFKPEGVDIEYSVDKEFASRKRPANIFMRTGGNA